MDMLGGSPQPDRLPDVGSLHHSGLFSNGHWLCSAATAISIMVKAAIGWLGAEIPKCDNFSRSNAGQKFKCGTAVDLAPQPTPHFQGRRLAQGGAACRVGVGPSASWLRPPLGCGQNP